MVPRGAKERKIKASRRKKEKIRGKES